MKKILLLIAFITLCSCESKSQWQTIHGTNPKEINGLLNFKSYRPVTVEYDLTRLGDGRLGPADYTLQAILYYDTATFAKLRDEYYSMDYTAPGYSIKNFNFDWLPKAVKDELAASPKNYSGHPGALLSSNPNCTLWFINNKVLVYYFTT
jgi:hypothetical protein